MTKTCSILKKERDEGKRFGRLLHIKKNVDIFLYVTALEEANMKDKPTQETVKQNNTENLSCINHNPVYYKFVRESKRL